MSDRFGEFKRTWLSEAPASRVAILRILVGSYAFYYLSTRYEMLVKTSHSSETLFSPVGVVNILPSPMPGLFRVVLLATLAANVAWIIGWKFRWTGPAYALLALWTFSYRNSWSMIFHSHNIVVFHLLILGFSSAADRLSWDAWRARGGEQSLSGPRGWQYGWPVLLMSIITVLSYELSGVAKVAGELGLSWAGGAALRDQVAVDALRKMVLGSEPGRLAVTLYEQAFLFTAIGVGTLVIELGAPLALLSRRLGYLWSISALLMHWGILVIMGINFRYQLLGFIFASFFPLERGLAWLQRTVVAKARAAVGDFAERVKG